MQHNHQPTPESIPSEAPPTRATLGSYPHQTVVINNPIQSVAMHTFPGSNHPPQPHMNDAPVPSVSVAIDNTETTEPHERRNTLEIEASLFKQNEYYWSILWVLYTFLYWTLLTWIPILISRSFDANLWGFIVWCLGFIGIISSAYTTHIGHYPSGATKENRYSVEGIGRWTAVLLTLSVIADCCVIVYVSVELNNIESTNSAVNNVIYNTNLSRLVLHIVHIFWSSLFFYNRFFYNFKTMAIRAFLFEWGDIIWSCIVSFMVTQPLVVDKIYFVTVGIGLSGWIIPMMVIKTWGSRQHIHKVATHLLVLDLLIDAPVIVAVLITQSYKYNVVLWIDVIWKSLKLQRSLSLYFVKYYLRRLKESNGDGEGKGEAEEEKQIVESTEVYGVSFEALTFCWVVFVVLYWFTTALIRCILDNEITWNYEYYTWFFGMIGILCVFDACLDGYSAQTLYGKPFMAFVCVFISSDCVLHAYELLAGIDDEDDVVGELMMIFHCIALMVSILFYTHSSTKAVRNLFILQWIDIILMFVVIEILNHDLIGDCFSKALCIGYFVIFTIKFVFWFVPILIGYANNDQRIHTHIVLLNTFTDLPLLLIIVLAGVAEDVPFFVFIDITFKLIVLLMCYAYHFVLFLKRRCDL